MLRKQAPAADAEFRIAFLREHALDQFDAGPNAAGILPAATGAAEPLAKDGARGDDAAFIFRKRAGK